MSHDRTCMYCCEMTCVCIERKPKSFQKTINTKARREIVHETKDDIYDVLYQAFPSCEEDCFNKGYKVYMRRVEVRDELISELEKLFKKFVGKSNE